MNIITDTYTQVAVKSINFNIGYESIIYIQLNFYVIV